MPATNEVTVHQTPGDRESVTVRAFDAPRAIVFDAWTNPRHIPHWLTGPEGWTMPVCEVDLREGGAWRMLYRNSAGNEMALRGTYLEVAPPERLVFTESWGGDWPETQSALVLTEDGARTTTTLTVTYPSRGARERALSTGMTAGLDRSFERLDAYLRKLT